MRVGWETIRKQGARGPARLQPAEVSSARKTEWKTRVIRSWVKLIAWSSAQSRWISIGPSAVRPFNSEPRQPRYLQYRRPECAACVFHKRSFWSQARVIHNSRSSDDRSSRRILLIAPLSPCFLRKISEMRQKTRRISPVQRAALIFSPFPRVAIANRNCGHLQRNFCFSDAQICHLIIFIYLSQ